MTLAMSEVLAFQDLKRRVDEIERALVQLAKSQCPVNGGTRRPGVQLRNHIAQIASADQAASAKRVLQELARSGMAPLPALRTVQYHLRALREPQASA